MTVPNPPPGRVWGAPRGRFCSLGPVSGRMPRGGDEQRVAPEGDTWLCKGPASWPASTYYDTTWAESRLVVGVAAGVVSWEDSSSITEGTSTLAEWATWAAWTGDGAVDALIVCWY